MKIKLIKYKIISISVILLFSVLTAGLQEIKSTVTDYLAELHRIGIEDIKVDFVHIPLDKVSGYHDFSIEDRTPRAVCGYQNIWCGTKNNETGKYSRFPISVNVSVFKDIWKITKNLKSHTALTEENIYKTRLEIKRNLDRYYFGDVRFDGSFQIRQIVKAGQPLMTRMIERTPDIKRGSIVNISVVKKDFVVSMKGKTRENGIIGEEINVILEATGKRMKGILTSTQEVLVTKI